jgi:hypothetical protein
MVQRLSELERWRIAELAAQGWTTRFDSHRGRARTWRGCEASAVDAAAAREGAGPISVAVVVGGARGDLARVGRRRVAASDCSTVGRAPSTISR